MITKGRRPVSRQDGGGSEGKESKQRQFKAGLVIGSINHALRTFPALSF